jgi:DNA polymerase I-like protein with 3'-5' exonuclease and polymerase domains
MVSTAWDTGKAAAIALWHPLLHTPYEEEIVVVTNQGEKVKQLKVTPPWVPDDYDPDLVWEEIKRLLNSSKPKILHNAGYDLKVFWKYQYDINNIQWDCMLFEHVLEEDKKGQYNLKYLTKQNHPEYSGYEDKLREILEKEEGDDQNKSIEKQTKVKEKILEIPKKVLEALHRLNLTVKFQPHALKKKLEVWKKTPEKFINEIVDAELVLQAKEQGEFKSPKAVKEAKEEKKGGFEKIPLHILSFYAAVDADVTRQLAISQRKRMSEEQIATVQQRAAVQKDLSYRRFESATAKVETLCSDKEPLVSLAKNRYLPRMRRLAEVEYHGIKVDRNYLKTAHDDLDKALITTEKQIYEMAGEAFNINSSRQLATYLTEIGPGHYPKDLELVKKKVNQYPDHVFWDGQRVAYKPLSMTKTGQIQTTEAVLKTYVQQYGCEFSNLILAYKKAFKAKNTFLKNVDTLSSLDGFLHTRYNINGTGTGRLSSSNMNMQNVPKGKLGGVVCKKLFIPDSDDMVFVNADAKGAEISIFAGYSKDVSLINALKNGMDAHCFFSSKILNPTVIGGNLTGEKRRIALLHAGIDDDHAWSYEDFKAGKDNLLPDLEYCKRLKDLRDNIKKVVFGILFGAGPGKIADIAGIELAFAKTIISFLFELFKTIPNFVELTKWELRTFGFVETYHGRRRRYPIKNAPTKLMSQMERRAVNFKIQGTNSDIVLDVLCAIADVIERDFRGRVLLTVHDSIGFQIPKIYLSQVPDLFKEYGTKRVSLQNPWLPVDYKWDITCGPSYGEQMSVNEYLEKNKHEINRLLQIDRSLFEGYTEEEMYSDLREAVLEASD